MVANDFEVISKSVCVFSFIGIIVLLALKFLFKGDKDDSLKKVIGGLGVFTVAIVSNNSYIYVLALFIGGLLIASERFLLFLASIFKAESHVLYVLYRWSNLLLIGKNPILMSLGGDWGAIPQGRRI